MLSQVKLCHAIHAITLLSLASHGEQELLREVLTHYQRAITATLSSTNTTWESLTSLHYILLLYDIWCATHDPWLDRFIKSAVSGPAHMPG